MLAKVKIPEPFEEVVSLSEKWDKLLEMGVEEETIRIVTDINGYNDEALNDILYAKFGYRNFEQLNEEEDEDE